MDGAARLFVYYRVHRTEVRAWSLAARALHAHWQAADPALACSLSQRADEAGELLTVMETYQHPAGLSADRQTEIETAAEHALAAWIVGPRRSERFLPCA